MFASPFSCILCMYVLEAFFQSFHIFLFCSTSKNEMVEKKKYKKFSEFFSSSLSIFFFCVLGFCHSSFFNAENVQHKIYNIFYFTLSNQ